MSTTKQQTTEAAEAPQATTGKVGPPFVERLSDRMNPILVKEVRQAMKSRAFLTTFMLLIAACWLVSIIGAISVGASLEYYSYAERFFVAYFIPLAVAIGVIVPFLAYHSMLNERFDDTFDMLSITTLDARRIVGGKLTNAIVLVLLCFSAITPFIAFTSLLQGFRLTPVVFTLIIGGFASVGLCALALLASTLASTRVMQGIVALILLGALGYTTSLCTLLFVPGFWSMPASVTMFGVLAVLCLAIVFLVMLIREITVAQITFASDNRATGVRMVTTILYIFAIAAVIGFAWFNRRVTVTGMFSFVSVLLLGLLVFVGYFSCTESPNFSPRVAQQVSRWHRMTRLVAIPWLPGCYRGYLFCVIHVIPLLIVNGWIWQNQLSYFGRGGFGQPTMAFSIGVYALFYAGLATLISSIFHARNPSVRSTLVRATFLTIVAFMAVLPHFVVTLVEEWRSIRIGFGLHYLTSPFATIAESTNVDRYGNSARFVTVISALILSTLGLLVVNFTGIATTIMRTLNPLQYRVRPLRESDQVVTSEVASQS